MIRFLQRHGVSILAVLVTPFLYGWAFPLRSIHWLGWIAFVPWFVAIRSAGTREALLVTSVTTFTGVFLVAGWLVESVSTYYQRGFFVAFGMFTAVWLLTVAPSVWIFTLVYRRISHLHAAVLPLVAAAVWVACELGRVRLFFEDPFGMLGYTQAGSLRTMQVAELGGIYAVSFVVAAVQLALVELWLSRGSSRMRGALLGVAFVSVLVAGVQWFGASRLAYFDQEAEERAGQRKSVLLVQGDLDFGWQWRREFYGKSLERYLRLTYDHLQKEAADLVVWPESSMTFFPEEEPLYRFSISKVLGIRDVPLLAGGPARAAPGSDLRFFNSAFVFAPDGEITGRYDKQRLLPFAEYYPLGAISLVRRQFDAVKEFVPGGELQLLDSPVGRLGLAICNEVMFPEIVRDRVTAGAEVLVTLANDQWLGSSQFARESTDMARFRAVELRRYLVRASTSGPSAIIAPSGEVDFETAEFEAATAVASLYPRSEQTLYARFGDWFAWACVFVALAGLLSAGLRRRQALG